MLRIGSEHTGWIIGISPRGRGEWPRIVEEQAMERWCFGLGVSQLVIFYLPFFGQLVTIDLRTAE